MFLFRLSSLQSVRLGEHSINLIFFYYQPKRYAKMCVRPSVGSWFPLLFSCALFFFLLQAELYGGVILFFFVRCFFLTRVSLFYLCRANNHKWHNLIFILHVRLTFFWSVRAFSGIIYTRTAGRIFSSVFLLCGGGWKAAALIKGVDFSVVFFFMMASGEKCRYGNRNPKEHFLVAIVLWLPTLMLSDVYIYRFVMA